ncbi:MAG: DUF58 domain-containing protein [Methylacidiphilales bacterium]|nr:DUF58 domain-containing protein [Candidatus Methylacidiphilales bacterium]
MPPVMIPPRRTTTVLRTAGRPAPAGYLPPQPVTPLDLALLHDLPSLELRARFLMNGFLTGLHRSPLKGFSVEFAEYRAYQLGDDLRRVDWRLYGRTDRLHVKQFEHETQLRVFLVLDTSASMAYASRPEQWLRKIDFARTLLAALGLLALRQGDAFGVALIGTDLTDFMKPKASQAHWRSALGRLDSMQSGGATGLATGLSTLAEVMPKRSLVVIASDFYEESTALNAALRRLRFDHQEVIALHVLDPVEIDLNEDWNGTFIDSETGQKLILDSLAVRSGYQQRFQQFLEETMTAFLDHGGDYVQMRTDASPMAAIGTYLARREHIY